MFLDQGRRTPGLLDGATDIIGGDPLQEPVITEYTSDASGHIIIPAADGGGVVTWVRGVWAADTAFRYDDFMAGTTDPNAVNYMAPESAATAENLYVGGVYSTRLIPDGTAPNTLYHVRFSRRSGAVLPKGSPINGWPYNYVDPDYRGTAVDGDMYVMRALELAYAATGQLKYRRLAERIGRANLEAGRWQGNRIDFGIPFSAEAGKVGLYSYNADATPFEWSVERRGDVPGNCLRVRTSVLSGGPPYHYSGWGTWPSWNITDDEPFIAFSFEMDGGGCGRNIELSTRVIADDPAGDVGVLVPCLSSQAGRFTAFEFTADDFWRLDNVILQYRHKAEYWSTAAQYSEFTRVERLDGIALGYEFSFSLPSYGANRLTNGDFSSGLTGWTDSSSAGGTVTVTDGVATLTHTTGRARLRQGVTVAIGKTYLIEFTCSGFAAAAPFVDIGTAAGSGAYFGDFVCTNGLMTAEVTASGAELWLNFFSDDVGTYSLDNVRIREYLSPGQSTSGDIGIDTTAVDSTGAAVLHVDMESTVSGAARLSVRDADSVSHTLSLTLQAGVRTTHDFTFADYPGLVHPIDQITLKPIDHGSGMYTLLGIWLDDVVTFQDLIDDDTANAFEGFEFQFPSHAETDPAYDVRFANILLGLDIIDGTPADRQRYAGLPRWTYKWTQADDTYVGYGSWRGWSAPGYLWMGGWTLSNVINPDNGRRMIDMMRDFMTDAQAEYHAVFGHMGPVMPRYGRAAWEALNQEGVVEGVFSSNTYNRWYFPWNETLGTGAGVDQSDDWYGYSYRALLSAAEDYFLDPTPAIKTFLDNWVAWFDLGDDTDTRATTDTGGFWTYDDDSSPVRGIVWDTDHWRPPSAFIADGRVRYHYHPVYAWACIAQAMLLKYWTDGDARALVWMRRMVDYLDTRRITADGSIEISIRKADDSGRRDVTAASGSLVIVQRGEEGEGYTSASVTLTGDGTGAEVVPRIFAGRIRYYEILNIGAGYTWIEGTVTGDGTGATVCPALYQHVVGAFDLFHTGWEIWEIYNLYALLVLGRCPGGTVRYPTTAEASDVAAVAGMEGFFARNKTDQYPMMQLANGLPMHEYGGWDPYHHGSGIENPMIRDSRTRGKLWTETTGPALKAAVLYRLLHE